MFATRYGYKIKDFYSLTLRQIFEIKNVIEKRKTEEAIFEAKLHNMEIKNEPQSLDLKPEERKKFDQDALSLYEKMKKRYQEGNKNGKGQ